MFFNEYEIANGDVFNLEELDNAMNGCDAVHISLAKIDEAKAVQNIVNASKRNGIKLIKPET